MRAGDKVWLGHQEVESLGKGGEQRVIDSETDQVPHAPTPLMQRRILNTFLLGENLHSFCFLRL